MAQLDKSRQGADTTLLIRFGSKFVLFPLIIASIIEIAIIIIIITVVIGFQISQFRSHWTKTLSLVGSLCPTNTAGYSWASVCNFLQLDWHLLLPPMLFLILGQFAQSVCFWWFTWVVSRLYFTRFAQIGSRDLLILSWPLVSTMHQLRFMSQRNCLIWINPLFQINQLIFILTMLWPQRPINVLSQIWFGPKLSHTQAHELCTSPNLWFTSLFACSLLVACMHFDGWLESHLFELPSLIEFTAQSFSYRSMASTSFDF